MTDSWQHDFLPELQVHLHDEGAGHVREEVRRRGFALEAGSALHRCCKNIRSVDWLHWGTDLLEDWFERDEGRFSTLHDRQER